jgi:hypothetical protein
MIRIKIRAGGKPSGGASLDFDLRDILNVFGAQVLNLRPVGICLFVWVSAQSAIVAERLPSLTDSSLCALGLTHQTLDAVVDCASRYVVGLERTLTSIVSEERYQQFGLIDGFDRSVALRSDFLIVKNPAGPGWLPFRDVYEVDGKAVRDRNERLTRLFLEKPASALDEGRRIMDEGARYNIGGFRNVNVPTIALTFLEPANRPRMVVRKAGEKTIDRTRCWAIEFEERGRPTVIKGGEGVDVPASGVFWIEPATGQLVRTFLKIQYGYAQHETIVTFRVESRLNVLVPTEMIESFTHTAGHFSVRGRATYSNFKRFQVTTHETGSPLG